MKEEAGYPKLAGASLLSCVCAVEKVLRIDLKIDYLFKVHDNVSSDKEETPILLQSIL